MHFGNFEESGGPGGGHFFFEEEDPEEIDISDCVNMCMIQYHQVMLTCGWLCITSHAMRLRLRLVACVSTAA